MLNTNRLNCPLTEEISKPADKDIELKTVLNTKSEAHKAENAVKKFSGNCVFPNASINETDESGSDEL